MPLSPAMPPALLALAAAAFVSGANLRLFDALLPTVAEDFAVPPTTASIVVTAFTLAYGLFQIMHGPLGDRIGKLRVIGGGPAVASGRRLGGGWAPQLGAHAARGLATGEADAADVPRAASSVGRKT